jgi:hypothetical protein
MFQSLQKMPIRLEAIICDGSSAGSACCFAATSMLMHSIGGVAARLHMANDHSTQPIGEYALPLYSNIDVPATEIHAVKIGQT